MRRAGLTIGDVTVAVALVAGLFATAILLEPPPRAAGEVRVIDGDTFALDGRRVRLKGIDAPELGQICERGGVPVPCGQEARAALAGLVRGREVACRIAGLDRYGRDLGICRAGGEDLGGALVRRGYAVAYGGYGLEELAARADRAGIWAGTFERPDEYRRRHAQTAGGQT